MRRKSGLFIVVIFLFILTFFWLPLKNELPDAYKTPLISNMPGEAQANVLEAAAAASATPIPTDKAAPVMPDTEADKDAPVASDTEADKDAPVASGTAVDKDVSVSPDTATVIFTFDDGYVSDYELAYPILKKYGIRGTSYIIPKYQDTRKPYTLTWDMVKEMKQYGWVFGCHTYAHTNLTKMTADEIKMSMLKVNESFIAQGLRPPEIHAFPFGHYDKNVIDAIKPFRVQMRKAFYESKLIDPKTADPYEIDSCSADMRTEKRLRKHEALVDKAIERKAIIVFRCHCLYKKSVDDMGDWPVQTDSRLFEKLVKYCADKGCRFMTMEDLVQVCADSSGQKKAINAASSEYK